MKSYNHLFEQFISDENIDLAIRKASLGKKDRNSVRKRLENPKFKEQIKYYATHFHNHKHRPKEKNENRRKKNELVQSRISNDAS